MVSLIQLWLSVEFKLNKKQFIDIFLEHFLQPEDATLSFGDELDLTEGSNGLVSSSDVKQEPEHTPTVSLCFYFSTLARKFPMKQPGCNVVFDCCFGFVLVNQ